MITTHRLLGKQNNNHLSITPYYQTSAVNQSQVILITLSNNVGRSLKCAMGKKRVTFMRKNVVAISVCIPL